jgi:F-box/WD-40 domain protein 7
MTLVGHSGTVRCLHLLGNRLVSGSTDQTLKGWHTFNYFLNCGKVFKCCKFNILVWDLCCSVQEQWSSIACKVTMIGHTATVRCVQVGWYLNVIQSFLNFSLYFSFDWFLKMDMDKVVSGSYDNTLKIWNLKTGECSQTLRGHSDHVLCLQFNATHLVSGSADKTIKVCCLK